MSAAILAMIRSAFSGAKSTLYSSLYVPAILIPKWQAAKALATSAKVNTVGK
jgi:hypothetical protein